jgi:hypothetical protein
LAAHNEFNLRVIEGMRSRIDALIARIDEQLGSPTGHGSGG